MRGIPQKESCLHTLWPCWTRIFEPFCSIGHRKIKTSEIIIQLLNIPNSSVTLPTGLVISLPRYEGKTESVCGLPSLYPVPAVPAMVPMPGFTAANLSRDVPLLRWKSFQKILHIRTLEWINNPFLVLNVTFLYLPLSLSWNIGQVLRG